MKITDKFPEAVRELKNRDRELLAISECTEATADLLIHNWNAMRARQGDALEVTLQYKVTLVGKQNKIKTRLAYSERHTDEREATTEDPEQATLFECNGDAVHVRERVIDVDALPATAERKLLTAPPPEEKKRKRTKRRKKGSSETVQSDS